MKNVLSKLTCLMISFMAISCSTPGNTPSSSSKGNSGSSVHEHSWGTGWKYDETNHWHECTSPKCNEINDVEKHELGEWQDTTPSALTGAEQYAYTNPKIRRCKCGYHEVSGTNILPELRFNFSDKNSKGEAQEVNFMNIAKKNDLSRPEVEGTYTLSNCPDASMNFSNVKGTMKVRGNQTAGWRKKAFRIKFDSKRSVMGLNDGGKYKKWVLLADAKDTTLIRSAIGLYIAREVCKTEDQIWVCDYTPVSVYLNDQYWGFYYLGEQKEVKDGGTSERIRLSEPEAADGINIGYSFELDHYADGAGTNDSSEVAKGADGDPIFRMKYLPSLKQGSPSGPLATGQVYTYTMLSEITDGPTDANGNPTKHFAADYSQVNNQGKPSDSSTKTSNSAQLSFIRDKMEQLYSVLYYAAIDRIAKEIDDNGNIINSSKSIEEVISQYFDVAAWVDGFIINAFTVAPDLGYSSFYMSYDNTPYGDHKLRYDCPWDFDSNFGNRKNFYVDAQTDTYVNNTYNTWLYLLGKLDFFINAVKTKWNSLREGQVFENMFKLMNRYFQDYDLEIRRNHYRWPENDAASMEYNNFDEIRDPYRDPAQYKQAEQETINWCAKRVNFLESKWGTGRPNVVTTGR